MSISRILITFYLFLIFVLLISGLIVSKHVVQQLQTLQDQDFNQHSNTVSKAIHQTIQSKKEIAKHIIKVYEPLLADGLASLDKNLQQHKNIQQYYPHLIQISIFDSQAQAINHADEHIDEQHDAELKTLLFSENFYHQSNVHTLEHDQQHFDIATPVEANGQQYILLMSFQLGIIHNTLKRFANPNYFYQLHVKDGELIMQQGVSQNTTGYSSNVADTNWVLTVKSNQSDKTDLIECPQNFFILLLTFLTGSLFFLLKKISKHVSHDLHIIHSTVKRIEKDSEIAYRKPELTDFHDIHDDIYKLCTELQQTQKKLADVSIKDPLTQVHNRRFFDQNKPHYLSLPGRNIPVTVALIDLNNFKLVNDQLGHVYGDKILIETAKKLSSLLRKSDNLYRIGGDEFLAVLIDTNLEQATYWSYKVKCTIKQFNRQFVELESLPRPFGFSIGLAALTATTKNFESVLIQADKAMYKDKNCKPD